MVPIPTLWLPILLSAVVVFLASSLIHMALGYHNNDLRKLPDQDGIADALRKFNIPPGVYMLPRASSMKEMKDPEFIAKLEKGPVALISAYPNKVPSMGKSLVQWFIYSLIIGIFAAYVAGRALDTTPPYLSVFRYVGFTAFVCYVVAGWQESIWWGRPWSVTLKNTLDGLIYGLLTAGVFGWLWPR